MTGQGLSYNSEILDSSIEMFYICTFAFAILFVKIASDLENGFFSFENAGLYNIQLFA